MNARLSVGARHATEQPGGGDARRLGRVVEKDGLDHAREDLGHVDADDLRDHLGEVDTHLQGLGLDEEIIGELVQLPDNLRSGERGKANENEKVKRM